MQNEYLRNNSNVSKEVETHEVSVYVTNIHTSMGRDQYMSILDNT